MTKLETYAETEEISADHSASDEEEEAAKRALIAAGLLDAEGEALEKRYAGNVTKRVIICSCGYYTCSAIGLYGHPVPVFKEDIEPLFPQGRRDRRALELKGARA